MKIKCLYVDDHNHSISGGLRCLSTSCCGFRILHKSVETRIKFKDELRKLTFSNPETTFEFYGTYEQASQNIGKDKLIRCLYTIFNKDEIEVSHTRYSNFVKFKLKSNLQQMIDKIS